MSAPPSLAKGPLKLIIAGPSKVGKTIIANSLSEFSHVVSADYHPTRGVRILEMEKNFTGELGKRITSIKKSSKLNIELWDISGDKKFQTIWPALKYGAHGIIIVIDAVSIRYESALDEWLNSFCSDFNKGRIACFSDKKDE